MKKFSKDLMSTGLTLLSVPIGAGFMTPSWIVTRHMISSRTTGIKRTHSGVQIPGPGDTLVPRLFNLPGSEGVKGATAMMSDVSGSGKESLPQIWASSISTKKDLVPAIAEAAAKALSQLPDGASADLALLHVSSVYGNTDRLEMVVPELKKVVPGLSTVVGCSSAGAIGMRGAGRAVEVENKACLGLTLATLPGVRVQPFYLAPMDVPDPMDSAREWERAVRLTGREVLSVHQDVAAGKDEEAGLGEPIFLTYSTSQSIDSLGDFVAGMDMAFPGSKKIGVIASTVSSLTRSCVFYGEDESKGTIVGQNSYYREGMVGVSLAGDIRVRSFLAQGARRVGPTFHADKVDGPIVKSLRVAERGVDGEGQDDWVSPALPPLAMIKQVQKKLPYEDMKLVQNNMLVGVAPELIGDTPSEMTAISTGRGENFVVQGVVRTSVRDGSITMASAIDPGTRLQLFVRDREAAADEFNAALLAYKRREFMETLSASPAEGEKASDVDRQPDEGESQSSNVGLVDSGVPGKPYTDKTLAFRASGTLMFPGLDRGRTLWEEDNYQSSLVTKTVPVPLGGFFGNGVAAAVSEGSRTTLFGSSTAVVVFSPITTRPTTLSNAAVMHLEGTEADAEAGQQQSPRVSGVGEEEGEGLDGNLVTMNDEDDDFVVQRRDTKVGRAVTSGPVQYSVAESVPNPSNSLEALVWEKEAEVDRQRDRWPMSLLVSRVRVFNEIEENRPRDMIGKLGSFGQGRAGRVSLLAEIKRMAPLSGPMKRGDFDVVGIAETLEGAGVVAIAVNTDKTFFGCTHEDLTNIRKAVGVPVMCSDVMVYPYQIYQARLAGADAIKLVSPALPEKDLMYFHKISAALGMQSVVAVSSARQMLAALQIPGIQAISINNRNLATWSLDTSRVDRILADPEVQEGLRGKDVTLLIEAGLRTREDVDHAKAAGVSCVIVGEAILRSEDPARAVQALLLP